MKKFIKLFVFFSVNLITWNLFSGVYLDTSFGSNNNGIEITQISSTNDAASSVFQQADGKLLVAGTSLINNSNRISLLRYTINGILDTSFATVGHVNPSIGSDDNAFDVIETDFGIIITGFSTISNVLNAVVARYSSTGILDTSFTNNAQKTYGQGMDGYLCALQSNQELFIAGDSSLNGRPCVSVVKFTTNGIPDSSFGDAGVTTTSINNGAHGQAIVIQNVSGTDYLVVAGYAYDPSRICNGLLIRYTLNGSLDNSFGGQGYNLVAFAGASFVNTISLKTQSNNQLIALFQVFKSGGVYSYLARYNTDGSLDTSFGTNGLVVIDRTGTIGGNAIAIDSNDRIVVGGYSGNSVAVIRYLADGSGLDTTFGDNGIVITPIGTSAVANSVLVQSDGKIVIAGTTDNKFFVARYYGSNVTNSVNINSPTDGSTITSNSFVISGSSNGSNLSVRVSIDGTTVATVATDSNGAWNAGSFSLPNNTTSPGYAIKAELISGTSAIATQTIHAYVNVPAAPDLVSIASPSAASTFVTPTPSIFGGSSQAGQQVEVKLDDAVIATVTTDSLGAWSVGNSSFLNNGSHKVDVKLLYGTQPSATSTFTVLSQAGPQGPAGITGITGATGISGLTGRSGVTGISGLTGLSGQTGLSGITGATGRTGFSGITGLSGMTGASAVTGASGFTGFSGITGQSGVTGLSGITGLSGGTGFTGISGITGRTGITGFTGATGVSPEGGVVRVDAVYGNDATCLRNRWDLPCLTVAQGLSKAQSGDAVWIFPGTYAESGLTIPSGVAMRGISLNSVTIGKTGVTADTDLLTMGTNTRVEDLALTLTSNEHHTLRGVLFPGTTAASAKLRTVTVNVDNSGAGAGTSNVYGVHSYGTGQAPLSFQAIKTSTVTVKSAGSGAKRALLVDTAANMFNTRESNLFTTCPTTACTDAMGVEVNFSSAAVDIRNTQVNGDAQDISQTAGTITLASAVLGHSTANGNHFMTAIAPSMILYASTTTIGQGTTRFMLPGTAAPATVDTLRVNMPHAAVILHLSVRCGVTINTRNDVFTLLKNGVATALTVTIAGTGGVVTATDMAHSVSVIAGDALSLRVVTGASPNGNLDEITATYDMY